MIFQGIFNILDLYFKEIDLFYIEIDDYFKNVLKKSFQLNSNEIQEKNEKLDEFQAYVVEELTKLGLVKEKMEYILTDPSLRIKNEEVSIKSTMDIYEKKLSPVIHEIILEKICEYLAGVDDGSLIIELKDLGAIPLEFLVEIRDLKTKFEEEPDKLNRFQEYMSIKEGIIEKFVSNKHEIESLEKLRQTREKLQLIYFIFRIINFFHMQQMFDFKPLETYLPDHTDDWLVSIPLVSLRNPDLFYCGIYLANELDIEINEETVEVFLVELWRNIKEQSTAPLIENTSDIYYLNKSFRLYDIGIKKEEIKKLIQIEESYFENSYLKDLETSQLVVILKLCNLFGVLDNVKKEKVNSLEDEMERRITEEGINQFRDGPLNAESTYYVIFYKYMRNKLQELHNINILSYLVPRIFRNLEILDFSNETNYDLFSEIFYSCETLKLINCIESKDMLIHLIDYMFPKDIQKDLSEIESFNFEEKKFRIINVDKKTGETIYR